MTINKISTLMNQAAAQLDYDTAQDYKNLLVTIEDFVSHSVVIFNDLKDRDAISYYLKDNILNIMTFQYQAGKLRLHRNFMLLIKISLIDSIVEFINYFYNNNIMPSEIIVGQSVIKTVLEKYWLAKKIIVPQKGLKKEIIDSLNLNGQNYYQNNVGQFKVKNEVNLHIKSQLLELLKTDHISEIAFFDNSHYSGAHNIGAVIINKDFQYLKAKYRYYKIGSSAGDDCKTFNEVIYRFLYSRIINKINLPDLLIIDGGLAQYRVAATVLAQFNLGAKVLLVSLVKDARHQTRGIIINEVENYLKEPLYSFLSQLQNEGDAFAKRKMHQQRNIALLKNSPLDKISGIGTVSKNKLLAKFKTLYAIKAASVEDLSKVVALKIALKIKSDL